MEREIDRERDRLCIVMCDIISFGRGGVRKEDRGQVSKYLKMLPADII